MKHLLFILGLALLASCGDPAARKLAIASEVMRERPDSALAILATIDPDRLDADSLRASYAYTRGWVNVLQHRSLVTDTLLPAAVSYYRTSGDTLRWALATRLQAARLWGIDLRDSAIAILDSTNRLIYGGQGKWELMRQKLEFDHSARRYADAIADLDWLICHTGDSAGQFHYYYFKSAALHFAGNPHAAAALADSLLHSPSAPAPHSAEWRSLMGDFAEYLNATGDCRRALDTMERVMESAGDCADEELLSHYLQLVKLNINTGDTRTARRWLDSVEAIDYNPDFIDADIDSYVELLRSALELREKGHMTANISTALARKSRLRAIQRDDAVRSMAELNRRRYELTIERQRLWIAVLAISVLLLVIAASAFLLWANRRRRLVEAEERIDALSAMLRDVQDTRDNSAGARLKELALRQLGILRTFAGSPSAQNQEALKKISSVGGDGAAAGALVDWNSLYTLADELYDNFHARLLRQWGATLTDKEIQIIVLLKAGFSTKEISVLTRQSSATVYVRKSAIRKKLGTPENADIIAHLSLDS